MPLSANVMLQLSIDGCAWFGALLSSPVRFLKEQMMKKSINCVFAVLLAAGASLAAAQSGAPGSNVPRTTVSPATNFPQVTQCDQTGCWGNDGTRYTRGAGNVMFGSNGKTCQSRAPGAPLSCN
jgi:hypothetical protein